MITEQIRRRRRGRAIRKARRAAAAYSLAHLSLERVAVAVERTVRALCRLLPYLTASLRVIAYRATPLLLTPRDGAGARRQLLEHGRAPRKGGRW